MPPAASQRSTPPPAFDARSELFNREVIRGVEMMSPRPARKHTRAASRLHGELDRSFDGPRGGERGPGGWFLLIEPELHLEGEDPVVPDLAGWRIERAPEDNDEAAYNTAPDWVCEVLSPSTRNWDREMKMPLYAFHRVGHIWLVDPIARELEVYALGRRGWELLGTHGGDVSVRAEPFEEVQIGLQTIWPRQ